MFCPQVSPVRTRNEPRGNELVELEPLTTGGRVTRKTHKTGYGFYYLSIPTI